MEYRDAGMAPGMRYIKRRPHPLQGMTLRELLAAAGIAYSPQVGDTIIRADEIQEPREVSFSQAEIFFENKSASEQVT